MNPNTYMEDRQRFTIAVEIDTNEAQRPLSIRERISLRILALMFAVIIPARYSHQVEAAMRPLIDSNTDKPDAHP